MFKQVRNQVELYDPFTVTWIMRDVGFGSFSFYTEDGKLYCENETMSKEFVKQVLCEMVDQCELTDK